MSIRYQSDLIDRSGEGAFNAFEEFMLLMPSVRPEGPWLAGGAIRRLIATGDHSGSDYDYFFSSDKQQKDFEGFMKDHKAKIVRTTETNVTWKLGEHTIQQIKVRNYKSLDDVLDSFDFTICQCGWNGKKFFVGPYTLWDLARKRLALHRLTYGVSTLRRLMKYSAQGFTACGGVMADILKRTIEQPETVNETVVSLD